MENLNKGMMEMLAWLSNWLMNEDGKLIYILTLILCANMLDFLMGWLNGKFNPKVNFSSNKAIFGIARKMVLFILLIYFIPVALLVPEPVGITALWIMYLGYLASEIVSILNHLKLADDDKSVNVFIDFVNTIFNRKGDK